MEPISTGVPSEFARNFSELGKVDNDERSQRPETAAKGDTVSERKTGEGRAMRIFRQEAMRSLLAQFGSSFRQSSQATNPYADPESSNQVASEILGTAKEMVEDDAQPRKAFVKIRQNIEQAATTTREIVTDNVDNDDVDDVVRTIGSGLDALESEMLPDATTSLVSVDTSSRQQSTIRIRTQEGDLIKFDLRRMDRMSATDLAVNNEQGSITSTEVSVSSRSHLSLKVIGDLSESELAAIQKVFAQAESLANEFFSGDIASALDAAADFDIDAEQLARVSVQLRGTTRSAISQSVLQDFDTAPISGAAPGRVAEIVAGQIAPTSSGDSTPDPANVNQSASDDAIERTATSVDPAASSAAAGISTGADALSAFLDKLAEFLNSMGKNFDSTRAGEGVLRFEFSRSFKLEILKATLIQTAPDDTADSVGPALNLIDNLRVVAE